MIGASGPASSIRRILVVGDLISPDGAAERSVYRQAQRLRARGHEVGLFAWRLAPAGHAGRLEVEEANGLHIWRTSVVRPDADDILSLAIGARFCSVIDAERPDLVHFHDVSSLGFSLFPLVKRRSLPVVVTLADDCPWVTGDRAGGGSRREQLPGRLRRDHAAWALAHADRVVASSAAVAAAYTTAGAADPVRLGVILLDPSVDEETTRTLENLYEEVLRTPGPPSVDSPLVLCAGDRALPEVAAMCDDLHRLEERGPQIRLVWHEWAEPETWLQAALLWNWSSAPSHVAMRRALRAGVPLLAPASCAAAAAIETSFGVALTYDTFLEGMVALARLPHDPGGLRFLRRNCRDAAAVLAAGAPAESYHLATPVASA
jgi:hypothetical protein